MVHEEPLWTYSPSRPLSIGYGHLHLLPDRVIGQWFCLDRKSGEPLWEGIPCQADDVVGVSEGVIVAQESRASGPTGYTFGAFGISLRTGELLWESHYNRPGRGGLWGRILRLIPIEHIDHAIAVRGSECLTARGRVLDVHTGNRVRYEGSTEGWREVVGDDDSPSHRLYCRKPVECGAGKVLRHGTPDKPAKEGGFPDGTFRLFLADAGGNPVWAFDLSNTGHFTKGNYFSYRYAGAWIYIVVSKRPQKAASDSSEPNPSHAGAGEYFLWALDVETGQVRQKIWLADMDVKHCSIDDLDDQALLVRSGESAKLFLRRAEHSGGPS